MERAPTTVGLTCAVSALAALVGCAPGRAKAEFSKGNRAYLSEDFPRAIEHYRRAVELSPTMAEARFYLGNAHHALADEVEMAYDGRPETPAETGAREARVRENLQAAVKEYEASAQANPAATPALARVKRQTLTCLARIVSRGPLRDGEKAVRYLNELVPLLPADVPSALLVAEVLRDAGHAEAAEERLREAHQRFPRDQAACLAYAGALALPDLAHTPRFEEAVSLYETCAALEPTDPAGPRALAMAFWDKGYRDPTSDRSTKLAYAERGLAAAERALASSPYDVEALMAKSLLLGLKATWVGDPALRGALAREADAARQEALETRRRLAESGTP
jgi:tetratricopeptide (TPR) repeat protein